MIERVFSIHNMLQSEINIWLISLGLFIALIIWDFWALRKFGTSASPFRGNLIEYGQDSTFGVISALEFVLINVLVTIIKLVLELGSKFSIKYLIIGTLVICVPIAVILNIWGKEYLISNGYDHKPKNGYKGFWQDLKDNIAEKERQHKERQQKKEDESLF